MEELYQILETLKKKDLYPDIRIIEGISTEPEVVVDGKKVLLFCSNNYLGLSGDKKVNSF